jgi:hypothetical protein
MKSKKRYAAKIAGLLLALALVVLPYADAVATNEDVQMGTMPHGGECGEPDTPSGIVGAGITSFLWIRFDLGMPVIFFFSNSLVARVAIGAGVSHRR